MDKNVHFVNSKEYYNEEFRIYDIAYLSDNIILSTDIIGQLIYYEITENSINFEKKEVKNIYPIDDLDNLISIFSIDTLNNEDIILGSSQGEIVYLKNNMIVSKYTNSKTDKYSKVKFISENIFASGDFKGNITLFDIRQKSPIKIFQEQSEEITDILYEFSKPNFLLTSSIDSTLCVYDIKKLCLYALSDKLDEELNCLLSYKNGNHILCGSGEGNILIFNWDWFGDFKDMIKGHPEGINDMVKYDENIFLTGNEDGLIRICTMYPKGVRGILKNKNENVKMEETSMKDVNKIKISNNKKNLITCSGMDCLRIFDISKIEFNKIYKPIDELDSQIELEMNNSNENPDDSGYIQNKEKEIKKKNKERGEEEEKEEEEEEEEEENEEDVEIKEIKGLENKEKEEEEIEEEENEEEDSELEEDEEGGELEENSEKKKSKEENNINKNDTIIGEKKIQNKLLNKKRKKEELESDFESEDEKDKKEIKGSDSDSDDSSSSKKKKTKKVKKIGKKTKSLIAKEERKAFFTDL